MQRGIGLPGQQPEYDHQPLVLHPEGESKGIDAVPDAQPGEECGSRDPRERKRRQPLRGSDCAMRGEHRDLRALANQKADRIPRALS